MISPGHRAEREGPKKILQWQYAFAVLSPSLTAALQAIRPGTESALGEALPRIASNGSHVTDLHTRNMAGSLPGLDRRALPEACMKLSCEACSSRRFRCCRLDRSALLPVADPMQADHCLGLDSTRTELHNQIGSPAKDRLRVHSGKAPGDIRVTKSVRDRTETHCVLPSAARTYSWVCRDPVPCRFNRFDDLEIPRTAANIRFPCSPSRISSSVA